MFRQVKNLETFHIHGRTEESDEFIIEALFTTYFAHI